MPLDPPEDPDLAPGYPNPQPTAGAFAFNDSLAYEVSCAVYTRQRWANTWTEQPQIICTSVTWAASPTISTAQLQYRYGQVLEIGEETESLRPKKSLGGYFVKIRVTCPDGVRRWYGFVDDTADEQAGYIKRIAIEDSIPVTYFDPHGTQTFSCVGILEVLNRDQISTTYFQATTANETLTGQNIAIALSPPFFNPTEETRNRGNSLVTVPSFTGSSVDARQTYLFHAKGIYNRTDADQRWSTRNIAEYLVAYASPRDYANLEKIPVKLFIPATVSPSIHPLPDYDFPSLDCEGLTLKEALDKLLSANNSLGYWAWVDESTTPDTIYLEPFTIVEADYTIGASALPRNARRITVTNDKDPATAFTLQRNESAYANQIVCFGARKQLIVTLRVLTEIIEGWPLTLPADFDDYVGPSFGSTPEDVYAVRDMRETGRFRILDRLFKLGTSWNFKYPLDPPASGSEDCFRIDQDDYTENFTTSGARYLPFPYRLKILNFLPLKEGIAYESGDQTTNHKDGRGKYRDLEAYGKKHGETWDGTTLAGPWNCWSHRGARDILYTNYDPSYYLEINPVRGFDGIDSSIKKKNQELSWALEINVVGAFQGVFNASDARGSGDAAPHLPELPPAQISITLALEEDRKLCAYYPSAAPSTVDGVRRRYFEFGDRFQAIELANDAVVGVDIDANSLVRRDGRTFVRDDSAELLKVATQLAKFYNTVRNVLRINSRRATATLWPGQLVTQANTTLTGGFTNYHNTTVNCAITEISISFPLSNSSTPGKPIFSVVTSKGEIDPLAFLPPVL